MIEVWGRRSSINVQKVMWAIAELGLPFKRHSVGGSFGGNNSADYLAMNPTGLVPVIRDGDVTMFESNAIVRYLAQRYGEGGLQPAAPKARAAAEQWMEWQQLAAAPVVSAIFWNTVRLPADKCDHNAIAKAQEKLQGEVLPIAETALEDRVWFAGDAFSFGDIVLGAFIWRYRQIEGSALEFPNLQRWFAALQTRQPYRDWVMVPIGRSLDEWNIHERELA
ncbi:glutathione S-transferase [soil metagenome]